MRRDTDASELRNDILRKNALIADLTALNERNKQNGDCGVSPSCSSEIRSISDGAVELELAQTKVRINIILQVYNISGSLGRNSVQKSRFGAYDSGVEKKSR